MRTLRRRLLFSTVWIFLLGYLRHWDNGAWLVAVGFTMGLVLALIFTLMGPSRWL